MTGLETDIPMDYIYSKSLQPPEPNESLHDWSKRCKMECQCGCKDLEICEGCERDFTLDLLEDGFCEECLLQQQQDRYESYNDLD